MRSDSTPSATNGGSWSMPRGLIVLLGLAGMVVTVAGVKSFNGIVGPTFLALMLTVAVNPLPMWLRRKGLPGWLAVTIAIACVYAILLILVLAIVVSVARLATLMPQYTEDINDLIGNVQSTLQDNGVGPDQAQQVLSNVDAQKVFDFLADVLSAIAGVFSDLFFLVTLVLFMAVDGATYKARMGVLGDQRPDIANALTSFAHGTRKYLVVTTIFGLIVAVFDTAALWALGIPLPVLWGLVSFVTNYIPNIGFVIGLIPPALLALLEGGPMLMLWVIVVYSTINVIIQSIIQPKFVGDAVGLSVTLTFLSMIIWTWILGPVGAILAIPLSLLTKALLVDIDPSTRWADILVTSKVETDEPKPSRRSRFVRKRSKQPAEPAGDGAKKSVVVATDEEASQ
ncbi:AI-2E family transporter [Aldersonia kunmingensis]|uniref:AI-2E family transporter n=1 Tax=Aldersonia kunmingensis TaxID=408066 RepID=UPI000AF82FC6|nr:AI-2E family transporter [Aldersonia kunmingensis]